ncbi:hypothetical protein KUTeg_013595 [Tegillarca granosa]|uniref:Carbohydrate-binding domain-containing protein n=1 Tax=Tegillarca granosa TaxID=220873 RepID=A0ABQ9EU55_TEGGR|nr:hypothetical protein KUTeg_013595 [Tegillarca granosa]
MLTRNMANASRKFIIIFIIGVIVTFGIGILIGHFAIEKITSQPDNEGKRDSQTFKLGNACTNEIKNFTYLHRYMNTCNKDICDTSSKTCSFTLPKHYIAYHLNGKSVNIDGHLDDEAWQEVPWSSDFTDIRGPQYPKPQFDTKFKLRWNDDRLYVAALLNATELWASLTVDESKVWQDNAFEVFYDADNSMQNYKEMEINVLNVTWDLMLTKAYIDCPNCKETNVLSNWTSNMEKAVHHDGEVNNPLKKEPSGSLTLLTVNTRRQAKPEHADWWSWQPTGAVALHLPHRWGLVQFSKNFQNKVFSFPAWTAYKALFDIFEALHRFKALNGMFITSMTDLDVPPYILSGNCIKNAAIKLTPDGFEVSLNTTTYAKEGHIRADRYTWFT